MTWITACGDGFGVDGPGDASVVLDGSGPDGEVSIDASGLDGSILADDGGAVDGGVSDGAIRDSSVSDGNAGDADGTDAGANRPPSEWTVSDELVASNFEWYDGVRVAMSANGRVIAIGADREDSGARGIGGDELDNSFTDSGAVYIFELGDGGWEQSAYIKASDTSLRRGFGSIVLLSDDGRTLAVGSRNNASSRNRAVYLFEHGVDWRETAQVPGGLATLSGDGNRMVVLRETSTVQTAHVFARSGETWSMEGDISGRDLLPAGSRSATMNYDGSTVVHYVEGNRPCETILVDTVDDAGTWSYAGRLVPNVCDERERPDSLSVSDDGLRVAVGNDDEDSASAGAGGDPLDNSLENSGVVLIFDLEDDGWRQSAYLKSVVPQMDVGFGRTVLLSGDGQRVFAAQQVMGTETESLESFALVDGRWQPEALIQSENMVGPYAINRTGTRLTARFSELGEVAGARVFD